MIHFFKDNQNEPIRLIKNNLDGYSIPSKFTFPFQYTPHPLIIRAANEVSTYLLTRCDWKDELSHGKMFGVLLVQTPENEVGYLAGFSGNLAGSNYHNFFVPPVFNLLRPGDFFKVEEENISAINRKIASIQSSEDYLRLKDELLQIRFSVDQRLQEARTALKVAKKQRDAERKMILSEQEKAFKLANEEDPIEKIEKQNEGTTDIEINKSKTVLEGAKNQYAIRLQELIRESQFQKAEFKRLEHRLNNEIARKEAALQTIEKEIGILKQERKSRSATLQMKLFQHFRMLNAKGEVKDLCQIFEETRQSIPPAGAGECALPKMLQYAYLNRLKPLAFGEFWWGESPKDEIRKHGHFYPSCKGKCEPILRHMLVGLEVESNPLAMDIYRETPLKILYEDEWIVAIDKPAGMLSTPGKEDVESVYERLQKMYPDATGPLLVHRLDMATSGILLAAKTKEIHAELQALFEARKVRKIYTALLDGIPKEKSGCINLPLCVNPMDRPRQMVNFEFGKEAITYYRVLSESENQALVQFNLMTGRTHQIRMHAAHSLGLNCPIKGDELYGKHAERLYLHATEVELIHPVTGKKIILKSDVPFINKISETRQEIK